jgi:hypothetical protein
VRRCSVSNINFKSFWFKQAVSANENLSGMKRRYLLAQGRRMLSTSAEKADLSRLAEELKRQGTILQRQEDLLTQLLLRLSPAVATSRGDAGAGEITRETSMKSAPSSKSPRGFLEFVRKPEAYRDPKERARDWKEINVPSGHKDPNELKRQAARCMDCGTPFCQTNTGCPINNLIPEWNELVLTDKWSGEFIDAVEGE